MDKEILVHIYNGIVLMRFSSVLSLSRVQLEVDEPKTYYIEESELERES